MKGDKIRKCIIARYDETIKEPPFLTIPIDTVEVPEPEVDHLGEEFCIRLQSACRSKGYKFKFYSMTSEKGFDYELNVE